MPKAKAAFLILFLTASLSLLAPAQDPSASAKKGTATVSGRVTLKGEPARNVVVYLQPQRGMLPADPEAVLRAKSGEDGIFQITGVPAGAYSLMAHAPGYVSPTENRVGNDGKPLNLSDGENVENLEVEMRPGGVITGRVTDSRGEPLVDERVELTRVDQDGKPAASGSYYPGYATTDLLNTDDRGVYRVYGVPAGRYLVSVGFTQRDGSITLTMNRNFTPRTFHPNVTDQSLAKVVEVAEGSEVTGIDITASESKKTYDVFGSVVNAETGQPVVGVEIAYGSLMNDGQRLGGYGWNGSRTDAKGEFQLSGVLPGQIAVFVRSDAESDYYSDVAVGQVGDADVHGVEVKVHQGGALSGTVVLEGTADPAAVAALKQVQISARTQTQQLTAPGRGAIKLGPDGSFRIKGLRPGKVDLNIFTPSGLTNLLRLRVEQNGAPVRGGIEVGPGEQVSGVRLVVGYGSSVLRGQVKLTGGELPADLRLMVATRRVNEPTSQTPSGMVDARGQFLIEHLVPGEYELQTFPVSNTPNDARARQYMQIFSRSRQRVTVGAGETQASIVIDLSGKEGSQ